MHKEASVKRARTTVQFPPRSYHPGSVGAMYALLVIFASMSSVSRFSVSGPCTSSSSHHSASLSARCIERVRARAKAAADAGLCVTTGRVCTAYDCG